MAVPIQTMSSPVFETGVPKALFTFPVIVFTTQSNGFVYGVGSDGQRFLASVLADAGTPTLNVIVNWTPTAPDEP
jgi:hypothetical protein